MVSANSQLIDRSKLLELERGSGRIVCYGSDIRSIEQIRAIEQQNTIVYANKYDRFLYDFGAWRKSGIAPVDRASVLSACRLQF